VRVKGDFVALLATKAPFIANAGDTAATNEEERE